MQEPNVSSKPWCSVHAHAALPTTRRLCVNCYPKQFAVDALAVRVWCPHMQVTALAMGRLYSKLEADNSLGQLLLPLLADLLTSSSSSKGSRSTLGGMARCLQRHPAC